MFKIKDKKLAEQIKKHPITKEQFEAVLKKACQPIKKQQSCSESSKT